MSELAFNINGEAFEVPASATAWRVRRMKQKGAPEVVYGRDGLPLVLPIDAELDDLRTAVDLTGRYRLDPIDHTSKAISDAQSAYVYVNSTAPAVAPITITPTTPSDSIVIEAMRMNSEIARSVIDRFPQMVEAAATLLRAADGAGLPAREPRGEDEEAEEAEEQPETKPGFDLNTLVAQLVPMLVMGLGGKGKLPGIGEMLDWRKAAPAAEPQGRSKAKATKVAEQAEVGASTVPENATDVIPPIDPQTMAHFVAVQSALTPEESAIAREVARELSAAELRAWFDELSKLSVPEAVEKVRKLISGFGKNGGAS